MQALMDARLRTIAHRHGIEFIPYAELTAAQPLC
jgi:hypothetical protein